MDVRGGGWHLLTWRPAMSARDSPSKDGDGSIKPETNHVQGTTRGTGTDVRWTLTRAPGVKVMQPRSLLKIHLPTSVTRQTAKGPV